jgi:hypothetical protein
MAGMRAFWPKDEVEAMLAAQATAAHHAAMHCFMLAMLPNQAADFATRYRRDACSLSRCMSDMGDALARKRGRACSRL